MQCKIAHAREWSVRLLHELDEFKGVGCFVTLTYKKEPESRSISKEELQKFFKRLRKNLDGRKIKYFACGEYGEKKDRPHYHAIILGVSVVEQKKIEEAWKDGFVYVGTVTYDSCRYVGDYIQKKYYGIKAQVYEGRQIPFQLQSIGIGKNFAIKNAEQIKNKLGITLRGQEVGIPRYYKKILGLGEEQFGPAAKKRNEEANAEVWSKADYDEDTALALVGSSRYQSDLNAKARIALKRDKNQKYDR